MNKIDVKLNQIAKMAVKKNIIEDEHIPLFKFCLLLLKYGSKNKNKIIKMLENDNVTTYQINRWYENLKRNNYFTKNGYVIMEEYDKDTMLLSVLLMMLVAEGLIKRVVE